MTFLDSKKEESHMRTLKRLTAMLVAICLGFSVLPSLVQTVSADEIILENGQLMVSFDDYSFPDGEENEDMPHTFVQVNGEYVEDGSVINFVPNEELVFRLEQYRDYYLNECKVVLRQGNPGDDGEEYYSTDSEDPDHLIVLNETGEFSFTPVKNTPIYVHVYWSDVDTLEAEKGQIRFDIYRWGWGDVDFSAGVEPLYTAEASNGTIRAIFNRSDVDEENPVVVTITPYYGCTLWSLSYALDDFVSDEYHSGFDQGAPGPYLSDLEYLTMNEDGTFTFTIGSFEPYSDDITKFSINMGCENPIGAPGFSVNDNGTDVYYTADGENYYPVEWQHFVDEESGFEWDEHLLPEEEIRDYDEITFKFVVNEDERAWKFLNGIKMEYFDTEYVYSCQPLETENDYEYYYTFERPEGGWRSCRIEVFDWVMPYDNTYMIYLQGDNSWNLKVDPEVSDSPVPFKVGEPIEFSIDGEVYGVYVSIGGNPGDWEIFPEDGVYSFMPENSRPIEFHVYTTEEEFEVMHLEPENENECMVEFRVRNDGFPEDVEWGSVEILENEHIKRVAESLGYYRVIVEYDREEPDYEAAKLEIKVNVPENAAFSVWMNDEDYTTEVIENDNVFVYDIAGIVFDNQWYSPDFNFEYREFGDQDIVVRYDECWWNDGEGEDYQQAKVLINDELVGDGEPFGYDLETPLTFKLIPPEGYSYNDPIIEFRQYSYDGEAELFYSTYAEDPEYRIILDDNFEVPFIPSRYGMIEINIWWSAFDALHPENGQVQVELNRWGDGKVEFAKGIKPIAMESCPNGDGRVRAIFDKSVLKSGGIPVILTPGAGNMLRSISFDDSGDWVEYVDRKDDENDKRPVLSELEGLVANSDGTYTYTITSVGENEWGDSFYNINAGFENPIGCNGISVDSHGARVYYSIDGGDFVQLTERHFDNEFGGWDEMLITPEEYKDADKIVFRFEYDDESHLAFGVGFEYFDGVRHRSQLPFDDAEGYYFTLEKPASGWGNYRIDVIDWNAPYDGNYIIFVNGEGSWELEEKLMDAGVTVNANTPLTVGTPIEFTIDEEVYAVYANIVDSGEERLLVPNNGKYSYTPDSPSAVEIKIYMTADEYKVQHLWSEGENQRMVEFWVNNYDFPEDAEQGYVEILESPYIKEWACSCGWYRIIVERDPEDPDPEVKIGLKVNVPENADFDVWIADEDITDLVIDNDYVYDWDVTSFFTENWVWNPSFNFHYQRQEGIHLNGMPVSGLDAEYSTDGGNTYQAVQDNFIPLDNEFERLTLRYLYTDPDMKIYGIDVRFGDQVIMERLGNELVYEFERGDHWITYDVAPIYQDGIFDCEWTVEFAMGEDSGDVTIVNSEITEGINRFGRGDEPTIEVEGDVYCIELEFSDGSRMWMDRDGNKFSFVANELTGFVARIYTSEEQYEYCNLWPDPETEGQYVVQYYSETEGELTGTIAVEGEVERKSYNGWTKVIFNSDFPLAVFTVTPADDYGYQAFVGMNEFNLILDVSDWLDEWPFIEFFERTNIADAVITLDPAGDLDYTGSAIEPSVKVVLDNVELTEGSDYEVNFLDNVGPGEAKIRVDGIGSYCGSAMSSFKIVKDIASATIDSVADQIYTGNAITPAVTLKDGDKTLVLGTDYTVQYSDNTAVGEAKITVTGTGFYKGTAEVKFKIYEQTYAITVSETTGGTAGVSKTSAVKGEVITVTVTPDAGYELDTIKVNDVAIEGTSFTVGDADAVVTVTFKKTEYQITVVCSDNGTASVEGKANLGETVVVKVTPAEGFELDTIKVDGTAIEGNSFTMPAKDVTVEVIFKEVPANGWVSENGNYYYYDNGAMQTGWVKDGRWYYLDPATGIMANGWLFIDGKWYYLQNSGAMVTGWKQISGKWYYFDSSGTMVSNWRQIGGKWYYFDNSGAMAKGWQKLGGKWYCFENSGAMVTGWNEISNKWYYFDGNGAMKTFWFPDGSTWYYLGSDGAMKTGWQQIGGKWYYFKNSGVMQNGWLSYGGKWYYLGSDGAMVTGNVTIGSVAYDFGTDGVCKNP